MGLQGQYAFGKAIEQYLIRPQVGGIGYFLMRNSGNKMGMTSLLPPVRGIRSGKGMKVKGAQMCRIVDGHHRIGTIAK